ncbi:MAG TPA: HD domain-containing phosphohydrolase [Gemmatimonadaceae bacterium]|nr:HD domain-containing phosphohydrolase [Gemmatimonadaceae bacterium]
MSEPRTGSRAVPPRSSQQAAGSVRESPSAGSALRALQQQTGGGAGPAYSEMGGDSYIRRAGRVFILALYGAVRAIKLYPVENEAVKKALEDLTAVSGEIIRQENDLEFRVSGEFIFINATRLRLDLDNYASFSHLLSLCRTNGVGFFRVHEGVATRDWLVLLSLLQTPSREPPATRLVQLGGRLEQAAVKAFDLGPAVETEDDKEFREKAKEAAKRTYAQSVAVTKDVVNSVRMGRSPNYKKIKRVVQGIVDQILNEENSLVGLTTIRDYDEYTFTHSVNVCIFSVALGRRLGLSKLQLYDLGLAALFHDIGKSRVPLEVLNKPGGLTDDEWRMMSAHPWLGMLALFSVRGQQELPYRSMVVAYEHHMKTDLTGYPRTVRPRVMSMFSKIVAVADGFDAATSRRAYQTDPLTPAAVLQEMRDNPRRGMDPVVVKAFINLTGIYPVGTLVVLDTFELALVHAPNPNPEAVSRPVVRIVADERGNVLYPGEIVDLTEQNAPGAFARTIIKTGDPERYGIRVGDYFV